MFKKVTSQKMRGTWNSNAVNVIAAFESNGFDEIAIDEDTEEGRAIYRGTKVDFAFGGENLYLYGQYTKAAPAETVAALATFLDTLATLR